MNIAILGATGFIGAALLDEALARGHKVLALAGHPEKLAPRENMVPRAVDANDAAALAAAFQGVDAVLSAFSGHAQADVYAAYMRGIGNIVGAAKQAQVPRLLVVGGAGSLLVAPGVTVLDTPEFPAAYRASAEGARDALALLQKEPALDWTLLSPSAVIAPGERTGRFRLGLDELLVDATGKSHISVQDYAVAMIDELEKPAHGRRRFTVGY
jgi:putative NADH-flavin reductase